MSGGEQSQDQGRPEEKRTPAAPGPFRQAALDRLASPEHLDRPVYRPAAAHGIGLMSWLLIGLTLLLLVSA